MLTDEHKPSLFNRIVGRLRGAAHADEKSSHRLDLLAHMPAESVCAEIGVWKGAFSRHILRIVEPKRLYLVDPWQFRPEFPGRLYGGSAAQGQRDMDAIHREVEHAFAANPAVSVKRGTSEDFFRAQPAGTLDWVYIDGDHGYDGVMADLEGAFDAVRPGGHITGDDFEWVDEQGIQSVRGAVHDFCARHGLAFDLMGDQFVIHR